MSKKNLFRGMVAVSFFLFLSTQEIFSQNSSQLVPPINNTVSGTYQIQVVNSRNEPYIPGNIEEIVLKNRKPNEIVYIYLDNNIRIKILSQKEVSSPSFQQLKQIEHVAQ